MVKRIELNDDGSLDKAPGRRRGDTMDKINLETLYQGLLVEMADIQRRLPTFRRDCGERADMRSALRRVEDAIADVVDVLDDEGIAS
tara:strand:+ start:202 stop:462 length:261 start_codon:yes stop_codon:yes gene_type:complete